MWSLLSRIRGGSYPSTGGKVDVYLDETADAATLVVSNERVAKTVPVEGLGFADLDKHGHVVALELLGARRALERLERLEQKTQHENLDAELRAAASRFVQQAQAQLDDGEIVGTRAPRTRVRRTP